MNQLAEPPGVHPYMCCPKGCCFSLSPFVYSWDVDFGHLVSNRVFFFTLLGMFLRSYFFVIIDKTKALHWKTFTSVWTKEFIIREAWDRVSHIPTQFFWEYAPLSGVDHRTVFRPLWLQFCKLLITAEIILLLCTSFSVEVNILIVKRCQISKESVLLYFFLQGEEYLQRGVKLKPSDLDGRLLLVQIYLLKVKVLFLCLCCCC